MRQIFRAFAGADHVEPAGPRPIDNLRRQGGLVAIRHGIYDACAPRLLRQPTGETCAFTGDVVATAKKDLKAGETLDGEGGYCVWGKLIPAERSVAAGALPIGLALARRATRDPRDGLLLCAAPRLDARTQADYPDLPDLSIEDDLPRLRDAFPGTVDARLGVAATVDAVADGAGFGALHIIAHGVQDDDAELRAWSDRIAATGWDSAFVYFKHEDEGAGPALALRFLELAAAAPSLKQAASAPAREKTSARRRTGGPGAG